jgi:ribosomal protein S27E
MWWQHFVLGPLKIRSARPQWFISYCQQTESYRKVEYPCHFVTLHCKKCLRKRIIFHILTSRPSKECGTRLIPT